MQVASAFAAAVQALAQRNYSAGTNQAQMWARLCRLCEFIVAWERSNGSNAAVGVASPPHLPGQWRDVRPTTAHPDMISSTPDGAVEPSGRRVEYHSSPQRELARLASRTSRTELEALVDRDRLNRLYPSVENENRQKGNFAEAPVVRRHWNARPLSATMRARLRGQPAVARHDTAAMRTMEMHQRQAAAQREAEFMTDELRIVPQGMEELRSCIFTRAGAASVAAAYVQPLLTDHRKETHALQQNS